MKNLVGFILLFLSTFTKPLYGEVKIGIVLDFTGPIMSLTPAMACLLYTSDAADE